MCTQKGCIKAPRALSSIVSASSAALDFWLDDICTHIDTGDCHSTVLNVFNCSIIWVKWVCDAVSGKYWLSAWLFIVNTVKNMAAESVREVINLILTSFKRFVYI